MKSMLPFLIAVLVVGSVGWFFVQQPPPVRAPSGSSPTQKQGVEPSAVDMTATEAPKQILPAPAATAIASGAADPLEESSGMGAREFFVSSGADAGGDGSAARPFSSIEQARDAARKVRDRSVAVRIRPGLYMVRNGLVFSSEDSGEPDRRVIYRGEPGGEVRISSGQIISPDALVPVSDPTILQRLPEASRASVRALSLDKAGLTVTPFRPNFRGMELLEVFWNRERLPVAKWPGNGKFALIETVVDNGIQPGSNGTFVFRGNEPSRWQDAVAEGLWLRGFWRVPWTIEAVKVGEINPEARTITLAVPISGGIGSKYHRAANNGAGPGSGEEPWEALNLIEAIQNPGDWAVRFANNTLYVLPPDGPGELIISDVKSPVVLLNGVSHFSLEGVTVEGGLGDGIRVVGGEGVLIAGCKVGKVSRTAIVVAGGKNHTVLSCDTSQTGYSGIAYLGGERATLTPGGHRILNNIVSKAGMFFPAPGIDGGLATRAESVGNLVAHNRIHDSANSGIVYSGNDNVFEYNEIYRIGLGSSDLGCFYTTGGWTSRGNVVRFNMVHHSMNANAFYVDDGDSGDLFFGNIAYKTESGGFIGGGHDQVFRNNIIVECERAMHVDARGIARGYTVNDKRLRADLDSVPYQSPPWSERYPELVNILEGTPEVPSGLVIRDNLFVACKTNLRKGNKDRDLLGLTYENNVISEDITIFVAPEALDFTLKADAPVFSEIPGFEQIPVEKIGIYSDFFRPEVPARDMELLRTGNTDRGFDSQVDVDASNRRSSH